MQYTNISWLDLKTSFYRNHLDTVGRTVTFKEILFGLYEDYLHFLLVLQSLDVADPSYKTEKLKLKSKLGCFSLNLLEGRRKLLTHNGLLCIDIDNIHDTQSTKTFIGTLPFIAWCGVSCSGHGLYCFVRIAEPERQLEYFIHLQEVFRYYDIAIDPVAGKNPHSLRYISFDGNPVLNDDPTPLQVKRFYKPKQRICTGTEPLSKHSSNDGLINWAIRQIQSAQVGNRFEVVRRISFTLGGHGGGLDEILDTINTSSPYTGEENEFLKVAKNAFHAGQLKPITV